MPLLNRTPNGFPNALHPAPEKQTALVPAGGAIIDSAIESAIEGSAIPGSEFARRIPTGPVPTRGSGLRAGLLPVCSNPGCGAGWLRLWRSRSTPVFEAGWSCSAECTRALVEAALQRERDGRGPARVSAPESRRHRIPLGLAMLEQGWITAEQLRRALAAQKAAGHGRLGVWLRGQGVEESLITRALGLQWSCPVLAVDPAEVLGLTALVPRLFVDAFGALPLRVAAGRILYLGFEDRLDPGLALALERVTGLRVESGPVEESRFHIAHGRALKGAYPSAELVEASSESALATVFARRIERARPVEARLVRVHDCLWLRMWLRPQTAAVPALESVRDVIASLGH
jgi:Type II secretion system (T2SS), protein E, N-terminal domain